MRMYGVMPQRSTIRTYGIVLFLQVMFGSMFILPLFGYATNCRRYTTFWVVHSEDGIYVYLSDDEQEQIEEWFNKPTLIDMDSLTPVPRIEIGPLKGILEFYSRESFLSSVSDYRWQYFDMKLSDSEIEHVHQELIARSLDDPYLAQFQPGAPPRFQFLPLETLISLAKVGTFFGLPAFITWVIGYYNSHTLDAVTRNRRLKGQCVHCTYDCTTLVSSTCPECGKLHTIPIDLPIQESHA